MTSAELDDKPQRCPVCKNPWHDRIVWYCQS